MVIKDQVLDKFGQKCCNQFKFSLSTAIRRHVKEDHNSVITGYKKRFFRVKFINKKERRGNA